MKKIIANLLLKTVSVKTYLKLARLLKTGSAYRNQVNMQHIFEIIARKGPVQFLQIGAFDGVSNDPVNYFIRKYGWTGVLVEPVDMHMQRLKKNYEGVAGLSFEQSGISDTDGVLQFYRLPSSYNEPGWLQQIGSFSRYAIEHNLKDMPELIDKIEVQQIPSLTLTSLFRKHQIDKPDLLLLDVEGYELEIIKQLNGLATRPRLIVFEWGSMEPEKLAAAITILENLKYKVYTCGADYLAVQY